MCSSSSLESSIWRRRASISWQVYVCSNSQIIRKKHDTLKRLNIIIRFNAQFDSSNSTYNKGTLAAHRSDQILVGVERRNNLHRDEELLQHSVPHNALSASCVAFHCISFHFQQCSALVAAFSATMAIDDRKRPPPQESKVFKIWLEWKWKHGLIWLHSLLRVLCYNARFEPWCTWRLLLDAKQMHSAPIALHQKKLIIGKTIPVKKRCGGFQCMHVTNVSAVN